MLIVRRIHIIGRKNSGKTTLIVELVKHFFARGIKVATIKHTHHHHDLDTPGKDSHRHSQAGAIACGILAPGMNAVFWPPAFDADGSDRYERMLSVLPACALVLVEGHSQADAPRIEVWRSDVSERPLAVADHSIHAVVTDDPLQVTTPIWNRSDIETIATRLLELPAD
jgi:molybdopterin-guanine dinucleotide biosynthesis protein MobB